MKVALTEQADEVFICRQQEKDLSKAWITRFINTFFFSY